MLSLQTVDPDTLELLKRFFANPELKDVRLVGGTALALQYGHRKSVDIAAMKVNAIIGRGTRKDFIDLYVLLQHYSLKEIMNFYRQKYPEFSEYRALLSMTYFEDAEMQDVPQMFINTSWEDMKKTIVEAVKAYQK